VAAAVAGLDAPPINPANAAAASKPVDEHIIFVLRFMVSFLSMGNRGLSAETSAPARDSDSMTKNVTIQTTSGNLDVESPPFRDNGMDACLAG